MDRAQTDWPKGERDWNDVSAQPRGSIRVDVRGCLHLRGSDDREAPVTVRNLSPTGFMAECLRPVLIGSYVMLDLPGVGTVQAQVRWQLGDRLGAKFLDPISLQRCEWLSVMPDRAD